jgi:hypothetical protein
LRSRLFGARQRSPLRCAQHDRPSPFLIFRHCWEYLEPLERSCLCILAYPLMVDYAKLWLSVATESIAILRKNRPPCGRLPDRQAARLVDGRCPTSLQLHSR